MEYLTTVWAARWSQQIYRFWKDLIMKMRYYNEAVEHAIGVPIPANLSSRDPS